MNIVLVCIRVMFIQRELTFINDSLTTTGSGMHNLLSRDSEANPSKYPKKRRTNTIDNVLDNINAF